MEEEARWPKQWLVQWTPVGNHCIVFELSWFLLTQMYKWVLVTEQWGQDAAEITSINELFFLNDFLKTPISHALIP